MTDKRKAPDAPEGRRKRAAPTIDLTATEVPAEETASPQAPPHAEEAAQPASEQHPEREPEPERQPEPGHEPEQRGGGFLESSIVGGFAGAAIVIAALAALWAAGVLPIASGGNGQNAQVAALQKQVGGLQQQMQQQQNRPAATPDAKAVDALRQTVRKLESDIAQLPRGDATMARLTAIDNAMNALSVGIGALNKRSDTIAAEAHEAQASAVKTEKAVGDLRDSLQHAAKEVTAAVAPAQLDALQKKVAALGQSLAAAREEIAKTSATDRTARLALSAVALRAAVASGHPYQAELAQAKSLGADEKQLAPLAQFASSGVPAKSALAHELRALIPAVLKASGAQEPPKGFLERLQANAGKIVHFSPINAPQGDTPADRLARLEVEAAHDDIAAALADLDKLPQNARAPAQAWIEKVKAREQALAAARAFAASTARALGQTGK